MLSTNNLFNRLIFKHAFLGLSMSLSMFSSTVSAELTPYMVNDEHFVYSSISDVTWTQDATLLTRFFDEFGFDAMVTAINSASAFDVDSTNFTSGSGTTRAAVMANWEGARAFVDYLNVNRYGGSNTWRLPSVVAGGSGFFVGTNGQTEGDEFGELFYEELNGTDGTPLYVFDLRADNVFINDEVLKAAWTETNLSTTGQNAYYFIYDNGNQGNANRETIRSNVWVVSTGQIAAVPEPSSALMLLLGITALSLRFRHPLFASAKCL